MNRLIAFALLVLSSSAIAETPPRVLKHPEPTESQGFGASVVVEGNRVFVCTLHEQGSARQWGEVGLLDPKTGALTMRLKDPRPNPEAGDGFGAIMAARGDLLAVSGETEDFEGLVYLYSAPSGKSLRTLRAPRSKWGSNARNGFGNGLAFGDKALAIGAADGDVLSEPAGIFLFDAAKGKLLRKIAPPRDRQVGEMFGWKMVMVGGRLAVGLIPQEGAGRVLIYDVATGKLERTLRAPRGNGTAFGGTLLALGKELLVGEPAGDDKGVGAVHVYDPATGALVRSFTPPEAAPEASFGGRLAANATHLLVGALDARKGRGAAYLLDVKTGKTLETYVRPDGEEDDAFGATVALTGDTAYVWAHTLASPLYAFPLPK